MTKCKNSASELKLFVSSPCSISMNGKISGTVVRLVVNFLLIWGNRRHQTWPSCWCFHLISYKTPYFSRFCRADYRQTYDVINRTGSTYHVATLTEDRATDTINNLEKRWSLDIWFLRYTSGQTDRQIRSSQYSASPNERFAFGATFPELGTDFQNFLRSSRNFIVGLRLKNS